MLLALLFLSLSAAAANTKSCTDPAAQKLLERGMALQRDLESDGALRAYSECLEIQPACEACRYESGWSFWKLGAWEDVVVTWEKVLAADPKNEDIPQYMITARENLALVKAKKIPTSFVSGVELGKRSEPAEGPLGLLLLARRQSYNPKPSHPMDHFDKDIQSPKSVHFALDGKKVYVNSLEGARTVVYDGAGLQKLSVISHKFTNEEAGLFQEKKVPWGYSFPKAQKTPNEFYGKPVELELSHQGRYLWIPYYRRSFDETGAMPSAVAVVDTETDKIVRVMPVGPISKYVKRSRNGRWMAVSHWGDNTVGLIDIRGKPESFRYEHLLVVEKRVDPAKLTGDRDRNCGFCVRGLTFSEDDRYLFVTRMKGGGIATFRLNSKGNSAPVYLGTVFGLVPGPRDSVISSKGELFVSCNASGVVAAVPWKNIVKALETIPAGTAYEKRSVRVKSAELGAKITYVGLGARSIRLSHDEKTLFVTVNQTSELVGVATKTMEMAARIPVDSYPVGLDLSPDDTQVWVTSQGRTAKGGNSVGIFQARYKMEEIVPAGHR
jgi:DNA-binding beta-propeller fold protein YncE